MLLLPIKTPWVDLSEGHVKDLTSKYDADWLVQTSKRRLGGDWWTVMMMIFKDNQSEMDTVEDVQINGLLLMFVG